MRITIFTRSYILLSIMIVWSNLVGRALSFQLKNSTRLGPRRIRSDLLAPFSTQQSDKTFTATYTKTLIAGFVAAGPSIDAKEVMLLLDASILQHTLLPNVIRLKIPILDTSDVASATATVESSTIEEVSTSNGSENATEYGNFSVCGDTHGQFHDVINIFEKDIGGFPSKSNVYLFNGDFVDRGAYSIEVILTLLSIKLSDPSAMHLLRGNHESISMTQIFGFRDELIRKYPKQWFLLYDKFQKLFCSLPIAAVIENQVFVTHGGLGRSTGTMTIAEIDKLDRFEEPGIEGGMSELLWSDPSEISAGHKQSQRGGDTTVFGADVTAEFLRANDLKVLVRSHQVVDGVELGHGGRCLTVFSAPDYCGGKNRGGLVRFHSPLKMLEPTAIFFKAVKKII